MNDWELVQEYARNHTDEAFTTLVGRYIGMVHSSALRQVNEPQLAEEVTQAVFIILARKAATLSSKTFLSGWLFRTTRFVAAKAKRGEQRRRFYERKAAEMEWHDENPAESWNEITPLLDGAIEQLSPEDQNAILLRFFQGKAFHEVGMELGSSEEAARKRVDRSIDKLRSVFRKEGYAISAIALAGALSMHAVQLVPEELTVKVLAATASPTAQIGTIAELADSVDKSIALTKLSLGVACGLALVVAILMVVGGGFSAPIQTPRTNDSQLGFVNSSIGTGLVAGEVSKQAAASANRMMLLKVLDAVDQHPLAGVQVLGRSGDEKNDLQTDVEGLSSVPLPGQKLAGFTLWVSIAGYVPKIVQWDKREINELPTSYTVRLDRGAEIGGIVQTAAGEPIANAKLQLVGLSRNLAERENIDYHPTVNLITTRSDGRWLCDMISTSAESVYLSITHPGFASAETNISLTLRMPTNLVITLQEGLSLAGKVATAEGLPIAGAVVKEARNRVGPKPSSITDADGAYRFSHMLPGMMTVSVQAKGFSALISFVDVEPGMSQTNFVLETSPILYGRVVDEQGQPVPEALVGTRTDSGGNDPFGWQTTTDSKGYFMWDSAPREGVDYNVVKESYSWDNGFRIAADGTEHILQIRSVPKVLISGKVVDAASLAPLANFRVLRQEIYNLSPLITNEEFTLLGEGRDGTFDFPLTSPSIYAIQIRADGWISETSQPKKLSDGNQVFEFKLRKGSALLGRVVTDAGKPLAGAQVFLRGSGSHVTMYEGRFSAGPNDPHLAVTDADGRFTFKTATEAKDIIVVHEQGFAIAPIDHPSAEPIVIQAWSRIEGIARSAVSRTGARVEVHSYRADLSPISGFEFSYQTWTDDQGRFCFEKIPSGRAVVSRMTVLPGGFPSRVGLSHKVLLDLNPGRTENVILGGTGRTITGRLIAEKGGEQVEWTHDLQKLKLQTPDMAFKRGQQEKPEGDSDDETAFYPKFSSDGSFQVDDVTPGTYLLLVQLTEPRSGSMEQPFLRRKIGSGAFDVIVPEGEGSGDSVDIGTMKVSMTR